MIDKAQIEGLEEDGEYQLRNDTSHSIVVLNADNSIFKRKRRSTGNNNNQNCWACANENCEKWHSIDNRVETGTGDHEAFNPR